MVGRAVRLEGGLIVVDLVEEEMVRIAREVENVEPAATWLRGRSSAVLLDRGEIVVALGRHDIEIDGIDKHSGRLRVDALAGGQQDEKRLPQSQAWRRPSEIDLSMVMILPDVAPELFPVRRSRLPDWHRLAPGYP